MCSTPTRPPWQQQCISINGHGLYLKPPLRGCSGVVVTRDQVGEVVRWRWPCKWAKLRPAAAAAPAAAGRRAVYRSLAEDGAGVTCSCSAAVWPGPALQPAVRRSPPPPHHFPTLYQPPTTISSPHPPQPNISPPNSP